mmetsp:Transcript_18001/g.28685  ORF Transcript_18001/g.28685 Transcript_18001/m.28685 type:complete len:155 (-) Transcript_18001:15-479(-)|eukprot:jgi/Bigna1/91616/estExt_fgenesh1_pg.C_1090025
MIARRSRILFNVSGNLLVGGNNRFRNRCPGFSSIRIFHCSFNKRCETQTRGWKEQIQQQHQHQRLCTLSDTSRESELFWNSKNKAKTDESIPRKHTEIPDHASKFEEATDEEYTQILASAESKLHRKNSQKSDKEVWDALSKARKYQMMKKEKR